jgi:predicted peptidase
MSHENNEFVKVIPSRDFTKEMLVSEDGYTLPYRLFIPRDYDCGVFYPLMLFMHGAGERGCGNEAQVEVALPHVFDDPDSPAYNSIIIAPQCPEDKQWVYTPWDKGNYTCVDVVESRELQAVVEIIKNVCNEYNVDKSRIYVTGLSMGGFASWDLMARHPGIFAAGMPVCGGGDPTRAKVLAEIPIRTFHGLLDDVVPTEGTREMYAAVKAQGKGNITFSEFADGDHAIWDRVYMNKTNINWLFSHVKPQRKSADRKIDYRKVGAAGLAIGLIGAALIVMGKKKKK